MIVDAKTIYTEKALQSLPRLLSLLDRNPFSPTYGCFHRDYWLYKTSDFPDAVRQFGVHALALVYAHPFTIPDTRHPTPYYQNPRIRDWAVAALDFWAKIQHPDGSFDEFYPFERGWVGPTAFTTYAAAEAYRLLRDAPTSKVHVLETSDVGARVRAAIHRAAYFIAAGETEEDHLANHHAMAFLAVSTAADVLDDAELRHAAPKLLDGFLRYHVADEGWSREYDGADPGYLSATVSFLAKVYARRGAARQDPSLDTLRAVLEQAVEFCGYFVYPDGSYAGILGSRNTVHFYPHGFELLAGEMPLAGSIAERMAAGLAQGKLVPPDIMSDRYVHYRVPEYFLAALDTQPRPTMLPPLPYERASFFCVFPKAGIAAAVHGNAYTVVNLAKGGTLRSFDRTTGQPLASDSGWVGELSDGRLVTSQWIDPSFQKNIEGTRWSVSGQLQEIPSAKLFTLTTNLLFRGTLLLLGWSPEAAHWLKGRIRKTLILGRRPLPCTFTRTIEVSNAALSVTDELENTGGLRFRRLWLGGEHPVRYVPQSRFFHPHELGAMAELLPPHDLERLNRGERVRVVRVITLAAS